MDVLYLSLPWTFDKTLSSKNFLLFVFRRFVSDNKAHLY